MAVNKTDISDWFDRGTERGATRMIVVREGGIDRPVYVTGELQAQFQLAWNRCAVGLQVVECYDLQADKGSQLAEQRAWHVPA